LDLDNRLRAIRALQRFLDSAFRLPGTRIRFGWDPIVGLVPWVGDVLAALIGGAIIVHAHQLRVPRVVQLRMLFNVGLDLLIGAVPVAGDVADIFWKSNDRNMVLLDRHRAQPGPAHASDWLFVSAVLIVIALIAAVPVLVLYFILHLLGRARL
jgi:hypothetical protein